MRKFIIAVGLVLALATFAFAQGHGIVSYGPTVKHRTTVTTPDTWFSSMQTASTSDSLELKGYTNARIDADVTASPVGSAVSIVVNLACSNDSLWTSGDSLTFTGDGYQDVTLQGCKNYHVNIDQISALDSITIYVTPFNFY